VEGFVGTVIYQNLNVTNIAGRTFGFSMRLWKDSAPADGRAIALALTYVDNANHLRDLELANPDNANVASSPAHDTAVVSGTYTFPSDARKLVKVQLVKKDDGSFVADDIVVQVQGREERENL
jgi:hypothetical protein